MVRPERPATRAGSKGDQRTEEEAQETRGGHRWEGKLEGREQGGEEVEDRWGRRGRLRAAEKVRGGAGLQAEACDNPLHGPFL